MTGRSLPLFVPVFFFFPFPLCEFTVRSFPEFLGVIMDRPQWHTGQKKLQFAECMCFWGVSPLLQNGVVPKHSLQFFDEELNGIAPRIISYHMALFFFFLVGSPMHLRHWGSQDRIYPGLSIGASTSFSPLPLSDRSIDIYVLVISPRAIG